MAKQKKPRASKYEPKIKLMEGTTFIDLIDASLGLKKPKKVKEAKKD